jgi:uncharacterized protein YceK
MNKILPIILVVVLSGCATSFTHVRGDNDLNKLLEARHECSKELGGSSKMSCGAFVTCLRTKGWLELSDDSGVVVPQQYKVRCK